MRKEEHIEIVGLNHRKQLAENLIPLVSPTLVLIGITSLSIHAKAMQMNASAFLEEIAWIPFGAGVFGLLLVQLTFRQSKAERKQTGYFAVVISTACILLSFGALLISPQTQQSWLRYWGTVALGLSATVSALACLQSDDPKEIKNILNWFATSLILLAAISSVIAHQT